MFLSKNPDTVREGALVSSGWAVRGPELELLGNQAPGQRVYFAGYAECKFSTTAKIAEVRSSGYTSAEWEIGHAARNWGVPQDPL